MHEIVVPKKWMLVVFMILGLAAGLTWGVTEWMRVRQGNETLQLLKTPTQVEQPGLEDGNAQKAAVAGAEAFYTVDYQQGQQAWLDHLCSVSTEAGCIVYQNVIGPNLWSSLEQAQITTTVKVTVQEKVIEQIAETRGSVPMQIWRLQIELSDPWPLQKEPQTIFSALALVIEESGQWKFERFLTEEELITFAKTGGRP